MKIRLLFKLIAFIVLFAGALQGAIANPIYANLPPEVMKLLRNAGMSPWGMSTYVHAIGSPRPLIAHNADVARNPASVMKLLTAYVGLGILGPNYRWPVEIHTNGTIHNGVLAGNVYIKGYGAPDFDTKALQQMLRGLRQKGIHTIRGRMIFDDTYFNGPKIDPGAFDGKPYRAYNAQSDALMFNERLSEFTVTRGKRRVYVKTSTPAHNMRVVNRVKAVRRGCRVRTNVRRGAGSAVTVTFNGGMSKRCRSRYYNFAMMDPANMMYGSIKKIWTSELGGRFNAPFHTGATPHNARLVHTHYSKTLAELLPAIVKDSNNVMARQLMQSVGAKRYGAPGTPHRGAEAINDYLLRQGLQFPELRIENGSGLSRSARISSRSISRLLIKAFHGPHRDVWMRSMAIAGVDGTMKRRLRRTAVKGRGYFKTGSLRDVRGIAGYVRASDGRFYVVSILHNDPSARSRARRIHDNFIEWVYWRNGNQTLARQY